MATSPSDSAAPPVLVTKKVRSSAPPTETLPKSVPSAVEGVASPLAIVARLVPSTATPGIWNSRNRSPPLSVTTNAPPPMSLVKSEASVANLLAAKPLTAPSAASMNFQDQGVAESKFSGAPTTCTVKGASSVASTVMPPELATRSQCVPAVPSAWETSKRRAPPGERNTSSTCSVPTELLDTPGWTVPSTISSPIVPDPIRCAPPPTRWAESAAEPTMDNRPSLMIVRPAWRFAPLSVSVPAPFLVTVPLPLRTPA